MSGRGRSKSAVQKGYRAAFTGGGGGGSLKARQTGGKWQQDDDGGVEERQRKLAAQDVFDASMGFERYFDGEQKVGWLMNMRGTTVVDAETGTESAAVDLFFLQADGECFKVKKTFAPYFLLGVKDGMERQVDALLRRKYEGTVLDVELVTMEDLDLKNHLSGIQKTLLKVSFRVVTDLMEVKRELLPLVEKNQSKQGAADVYSDPFGTGAAGGGGAQVTDYLETINDIREFDVPYVSRVSIDLHLRIGLWYDVVADTGEVTLTWRSDLESRPRPKVLAYDIETAKAKLKFPDADKDPITMISAMFDGEGVLIVNRAIVSEDIEDFEYSPKPEYPGPFEMFNEADEAATIRKFFDLIKEHKPHVFVTYNGDNFDWPYVEKRAKLHKMWMGGEIGMRCNEDTGECLGRSGIHLDCFYWVKRDSYLPQGSQGLKAVTRYKLGYDPVELDPEDMMTFCTTHPQVLATYSVSDAVATYYLYMKYVHPFIFSLCNIIPMGPDDVLRKGSGTLCEFLLQVEAFEKRIVCPNKHREQHNRTYKGHLLDSETYIGGHVEALESGVFRSDIDTDFDMKPAAFQTLIDKIDADLKFAVEQDEEAMKNMPLSKIANYDEVRSELVGKLEELRDRPKRTEKPVIYHLDVGAMYPNIILTNRLQPSSMVSAATCAACDFNRAGNDCQRKLEWIWRGDYFPADRNAVRMISRQLESERIVVENKEEGTTSQVLFADLKPQKQAAITSARVKEYSRRIHKRVKDTEEELREAIVCQRENGFYVDTVRAFRDRRYVYKAKTKQAFKAHVAAKKRGADPAELQELGDAVVLYESLQLAHKCILNSFYGYVMRKGARWYSMEMAGVTTLTGARIIKGALDLVQHVGRALELDTDGIWCVLPKSFPEEFEFVDVDGGKHTVSYPCVMLNADCDEHFKNPQYQTLVDPAGKTYDKRTECSIFFEVDGPYKAMILPASQEEGKSIKKRYAVFEEDGTLAELKGFELKRRGELEIVKVFQAQIFAANSPFLSGTTLDECYGQVSTIADQYLDILYSHGEDLDDEELIKLLTERTTMSKTLEEYEGRKSQAITTALRLAQFLGPEMIEGASLACDFVISKKPLGAKITERAIPIIIFKEEPAVRHHYLKKWLKDNTIGPDLDIREIIDWEYYVGRLNNCMQKIVTIPAALQGLDNPVPRVAHPDWLAKQVRERKSGFKQRRLSNFFSKGKPEEHKTLSDLEDFGKPAAAAGPKKAPLIRQFFKTAGTDVLHDHRDRQTEEPAPAARPKVNLERDYEGFVRANKKQWKELRKERRRLREAGISTGRRGPGGVANFFQRQSVAAGSANWQILQIVQDSPATYMAWVLVGDSNLQKLRLNIPRVVYVNCFQEQPGMEHCRVRKVLPRSRRCMHLYRQMLPEERESELQMMMSDSAVEGVYEAQTPQLFKAVMKLGSVCKLAKNAHADSDGAFTLEQIEQTDSSYLRPEQCRLRRVWLYHSRSGRDRAVLGLFDATERKAWVYVVSRQAGQIDRVNTRRLVRELGMPEDFEVDLSYASVLKVAQKGMQRELARFQKDRTHATVLLLQSPETMAVHLSTIPAIADMPVVCMPADLGDDNYPPLGWETPTVKRMMKRSLTTDQWWQDQCELARFARIPIGNVEGDCRSFIADVALGRALTSQNFCAWYSTAALPDLGGNEEDCGVTALDDPVKNVEGSYRSICVELDLYGLAVNTILNSDLVDDIEGASGGFAGGNDAVDDADDASATIPAFRVLKGMVERWYKQAQSGNTQADEMLLNFYRWLRSPTSKLFDPRLFQTVRNMMEKVFLQLMAEFRSLGATLVSACFNKVILCTGKDNVDTAQQYLEYLIQTISTGENQLFSKIGFQPRVWWRCMLYKDRANYGGIRLQVDDDEMDADMQATPEEQARTEASAQAEDRSDGEASMDEDDDLAVPMEDDDQSDTEVAPEAFQAHEEDRVELHFNVSRYLPREQQVFFDRVVAEFIQAPVQHARALQAGAALGSQASDSSQSTQGAMAEALAKTVKTSLTRRLCLMVDHIEKKYDGAAGTERARQEAEDEEISGTQRRPPGLGDAAGSGRVALDFVKTVSHIFGLDADAHKEVSHPSAGAYSWTCLLMAVALQVAAMRRTLLRLLKVKEFAPESQFRPPCRAFTLPDVICSHCQFRYAPTSATLIFRCFVRATDRKLSAAAIWT